MEEITDKMAEITVDASNKVDSKVLVCSEVTSSSSQHPDLSHNSAQNINLNLIPTQNTTQDNPQSHVSTPETTQDIVQTTIIIRTPMRAYLERLYLEGKIPFAPPGFPRRRPNNFIRFPSLPKEMQLKIWKEAIMATDNDHAVVTEVFFHPGGTKEQPHPRYVPNKYLSPLLYTCHDSRDVALKEYYTLVLNYNIGITTPYKVYAHPTEIIYLQTPFMAHPLTPDFQNTKIDLSDPILHALSQGITGLALNLDAWSSRALKQHIDLFKNLTFLFFVVAVPLTFSTRKGKHLGIYKDDDPKAIHISYEERRIVMKLKRTFARMTRKDPGWEAPCVGLVGMRELRQVYRWGGYTWVMRHGN